MSRTERVSQATRVAKPHHCDVMVIGGGPGGSAAATHLARVGLDVVLVERERHPRFHIGESLLPHSLPMLDELGVLGATRKIGVYKPGAEFINEEGDKEAEFYFSRSILDGPGHAYQVLRAEFDQLLFDNAINHGARAMQETRATVTALETHRALVKTEGPDGTREWRTRFLVDASGRSTLTSKLLADKQPDRRNASAAIFGHFLHVPRKAGARGGNIRIHLTRPGWMWQIPLRDNVTSIGWVAPSSHLATRGTGVEALFESHCARHPSVGAMLVDAERVGELRTTGNFSYRASRACGSSHVKVGDSYGFIDPIFSTGVHLALISAREAAETIEVLLATPTDRERHLRAYHLGIERRLDFVSWFIYHIHDPAFRHMMVNPRNILGVEQAMISLLSGDFRTNIQLRSRIALFRMFHFLAALRHPVG